MRRTAVVGGLAGIVALVSIGNVLAVHPAPADPAVALATGPETPAPPATSGDLTSSPPARTSSAAAAPVASSTAAPTASATGSAAGSATRAAPSGTVLTAFITAYTWYDNDPPGSAIADPVLHRTAGGTGSWADPVTLAVADGRFAPGTRLYLPHVRRYFIVEDTCASCGGRPLWIDMWIDGREGSPEDVQTCAERLTGDFAVEVEPPPGRPLHPGRLFGPDGCYAR